MISFLPGAVSPRHLAAVNGGALLIAFAPIFAILSTRGEDGEEAFSDRLPYCSSGYGHACL